MTTYITPKLPNEDNNGVLLILGLLLLGIVAVRILSEQDAPASSKEEKKL